MTKSEFIKMKVGRIDAAPVPLNAQGNKRWAVKPNSKLGKVAIFTEDGQLAKPKIGDTVVCQLKALKDADGNEYQSYHVVSNDVKGFVADQVEEDLDLEIATQKERRIQAIRTATVVLSD